ncbi:amidohydrolase [Kitasatospora sp. NPDC096147]|uniref:amidohydrolase n=1 Tax=Kitasatospora sp. NPDC096147 TaxID=3364093 RepID=UPI003803A98F
MHADLILRAGRIQNFDHPAGAGAGAGATAGAQVVAVRDGRILAVGGEELLTRHQGPATRLLDLPGATVTPGLTDAHAHPVWGAIETGSGLGLADATTLDQVLARVAERIAEGGGGAAWVTGYDLDPDVFADQAPGEPSGEVFGRHFPGVPVSLMTRDAHALVVSPAGVERAGLTGAETFDDASRIATDADGRPTGYVVELQAMDLVFAHYPEVELPRAARYVAEQLHRLAAVGLTGLHALDFTDPSEAVYREIERTGELPLRIRCSPLVPADSTPETWREIAGLQGRGGRRWRVEGVKFMLDGTADNGSAWFEQPDTHGQNRAPLWKDPSAYRRAVGYFTSLGIPTATHAIGDRAVRYALDAIEAAGRPLSAPHRIEHLESVPDDLLGRFAELGVVASLQPVHGTRMTKADLSDGWSTRIGAERAARGWRTRDLLDHGAVVALGSDWPIGEGDPRAALADAQLRRPVDSPDTAPVQPGQGITAREAYAGMTRATAVAAGAEARLGRIAPGYLADLTVFAADPLDLTPDQQAANPVLATVVDGRPLLHTTAGAGTDGRPVAEAVAVVAIGAVAGAVGAVGEPAAAEAAVTSAGPTAVTSAGSTAGPSAGQGPR